MDDCYLCAYWTGWRCTRDCDCDRYEGECPYFKSEDSAIEEAIEDWDPYEDWRSYGEK